MKIKEYLEYDMKRTCLFCHYYPYSYIPNYVIYYLEKLQEIVGDIKFLTNKRDIDNIDILNKLEIPYFTYENKGLDFGMYYNYITQNGIECDQLFLVNDSMVLFNNLLDIDYWVRQNSDKDLLGITDSIEKSYHIQSFFLVMNKKTQLEFIDYLYKNKIKEDFNSVIDTYEVGFSTNLINRGFNLLSKYSSTDYTLPHTNPSIYSAKQLISDNLSMIKRKVIFNQFLFNEMQYLQQSGYIKEDYWELINNYKDINLNLNYLREI